MYIPVSIPEHERAYCAWCSYGGYGMRLFNYPKLGNDLLCLKCLQSYYSYNDLPSDNFPVECDRCYTVIRDAERHHFKDRYERLCINCVDQYYRRMIIVCAACEKRARRSDYSTALCADCASSDIPKTHLTLKAELRRTKLLGLPSTLTLHQWLSAIEYFGGLCVYCQLRKWSALDHYLPVVLGGGTVFDNCLPACRRCNSIKGNKHPDDFARLFPAENIARIRGYFERVSSLVL